MLNCRQLRTSKTILLIFFCLVSLSGFSRAAHADTLQIMREKIDPSVVLLSTENDSGIMNSLGSGFVVGDAIIVTNYNLIKGAARGYVQLLGQTTRYVINGIVGIDLERDLVLLSVRNLRAPALLLSVDDQVKIGKKVYAVGNPQGTEGSLSSGRITEIHQVGQDSLLQISAAVAPGLAGGPVLDRQGRVIGIAAATFNGSENHYFAIPVSYLAKLVSHSGPLMSFSDVRKIEHGKSILDRFGERSTAALVGEAFAWDNAIGKYTFSLRNRSRDLVGNILCAMVFHDKSDRAIDFVYIKFPRMIPPGLAARLQGTVDKDVHELFMINRGGRVEIRILDFQIFESASNNKVPQLDGLHP